ncbi:MAG TPA: LysM peptidoglycan-binding domain-containing protein [bacterium]|nr:LysM peptidoglycan-binding domain-containing protein [bacterium]HPO51388.1 LysM peptidoglycan-binding domain-containing protein [bacterium]
MRNPQTILLAFILCLGLTGCTTVAMKDDVSILKEEIEQKLAANETTSSNRFQEVNTRIEQLQQTQEQQQASLLKLAEGLKTQVNDLKIAFDDSAQNQGKEFELFKKNQNEKNNQFTQDIETLRKSQNDLIKTSVSLTDSMVNYQKDLLGVKTSMQQIATEIDALSTKKYVQKEEIENTKKEIYQQIQQMQQVLVSEITRQESEIFALKQALKTLESSRKIENTPPTKESAEKTYHIVKKGETLSSIAKKYGTTMKKIKEANNMKTDIVTTGQKLLIP